MKLTAIILPSIIVSAAAFVPSSVTNVARSNTELSARPKLANKKTAVAKGATDKKSPISFPKPDLPDLPSFQLPWDKPAPVEPVKAVKKGRKKVGAVASRGKSPALVQRVFDMDLYAPVADQNDYGARNKKNLKTGQLSKKSYVPAGMTKAQYEKIRAKDTKKKRDNYQKNVDTAGKFSYFYDFYKNRGTDLKDSWRSVTNSHTMAKTKYDWQGDDDMSGFGSTGR